MKQRALHALILLNAMVLTCFSVRAEETAPDADASYPLTVTYTFTDLSRSDPVDGAEITVIQVASVSESGQTPVYVPLFDETQNFQNMSAKESEEAAARLAEKTGTSASGFKTVTEADGSAVFHDLKPGIYLVTETGKTGTAASYETFRPFLIPVPEYGVNEYGQVTCSDAVACEKAETIKDPVYIMPPQISRKERAANTYDKTHTGMWYFLLQCSIALSAWSFLVLRWKEKENAQ